MSSAAGVTLLSVPGNPQGGPSRRHASRAAAASGGGRRAVGNRFDPRSAAADDDAAIVDDGRMVDRPVLTRAVRILAADRRGGR